LRIVGIALRHALKFIKATTQEILRAAAAIVETSWSAQEDALDAEGKKVPLHIAGIGDTARAGLNPDAVRFSAYGAITKATKEAPKAVMTLANGIPVFWHAAWPDGSPRGRTMVAISMKFAVLAG
jgi:hypothetical protein